MRLVLDGLLPRVLPDGVSFQTVAHEGKTDLRGAIPNKLSHWHEAPGVSVGFVIVHDRDASDCHELKDDLLRLCATAGSRPALVRIPCPCLESWYLGDLTAVERGLGQPGLAKRLQGTSRYRDPDVMANAKQEMDRLVTQRGQLARARAIAPHMDLEANRSRSFRVFISGVRGLAQQLPP